MRHRFPLHRIGMHVFQLYSAFSCAPYVEILQAALPELAQRRIFVSEPQPQLLRGAPSRARQSILQGEVRAVVSCVVRCGIRKEMEQQREK
jgi:hypothetical protein